MRILHVIQTLDPATGGPAAVAARLAAAQAALGQDVALASYADAAQHRRIDLALAGVPGMERCRRVSLGDVTAMERLTASRAVAILRREFQSHASNRPDVVHLHGVWEPLLLRAARLARRSGVPYVVRPCGMLDPWSLRQSALKKRIALTLAYRAMLDRAAFLHALNPDEARLIEPMRLRCPVRIIPNGVFLEEVRPLPPAGSFCAAHRGALGDRPFVLFLSRLHRKKGLDVLAEAFGLVAARAPDVQLVVAGPEEGAGDDFRARIAAAGVTSRVHMLGPLYGADKLAALVDAACFVLPSRQEGFSVAILEALACGTPVVISEACHFPQVADRGAGRVTTLDPRALADAMLGVLNDTSSRQHMGAAGIRLIEEHYTWPRIARLALDAYSMCG